MRIAEDKSPLVQKIIEENYGIVKAEQLAEAGIRPATIKKLRVNGFIEQLTLGFYKLASAPALPEIQLVTTTIPRSVIYLQSALYQYGYIDTPPELWQVAVPRTSARDISSFLPVRFHFVKNDIYALGKTEVTENGMKYVIYDRERTMCDLYKYRFKLGNEMVEQATKAYLNDPKKNPSRFSEYAPPLRMTIKMRPLFDALGIELKRD